MKIGTRNLTAAVFGAFALASVMSGSVRAQDDLAEGAGKSDLVDACSGCHDTGLIVAQRHAADEWSDTVTRMVGLGATVTDAQYKSIVDYLTAHYGPQGAPGAAAASPAAAPAAAASGAATTAPAAAASTAK